MHKIKELSLSQRPRERLLTMGAETLTDAELLAIFLRVGVAGKSAIDLAEDLITHYGLAGVFELKPQQVKGIGKAKVAQIKATLELTKRYLANHSQTPGYSINQPQAIIGQLQLTFKNTKKEIFLTVFLNNQNQVITLEEMFRGTINKSAVYPREIVKRALELDAAKVIISHNHPSGHLKPSHHDEQVTTQIQRALSLLDIDLIDHIIIADNRYYSFAEKGKIAVC